MRINKWSLIVLAINIGLLYFTIYAFRQYQHRQEIVKFAHPITEYSLLEVDCHSRMSSNIKIAYLGKEYFVGVTKKKCQNIESVALYYDTQHDEVFEKDELRMSHVATLSVIFLCSLLLWFYPEVRNER